MGFAVVDVVFCLFGPTVQLVGSEFPDQGAHLARAVKVPNLAPLDPREFP